eukprot:SAG11_NODE_5689_length_1486_cov_1.371305_2_plen_170_part_00
MAARGHAKWGPDREKAKAYREGTCPRRPWSVTVGGFGDGLLIGKDQVERLLQLLLPILSTDYPVQGSFKLDLDADDLRFFIQCANPIGAVRLAERLKGFSLEGEDAWAELISESLPKRVRWQRLYRLKLAMCARVCKRSKSLRLAAAGLDPAALPVLNLVHVRLARQEV